MDNRKLRYSLMMLAALVAFGTIGYYFFERMPIFDDSVAVSESLDGLKEEISESLPSLTNG